MNFSGFLSAVLPRRRGTSWRSHMKELMMSKE